MSILQGFAKKGTEDQAKLKAYSMSELQLDPKPLCTVLVDNIDMWQEMLTEAQMCEGDPVVGSPKNRENAANMVIMYRQQLSQLPCHR